MRKAKRTRAFYSEVVIYILFVLNICQKFLMQGITCNDEVQLRLLGQRGMDVFFKTTIVEEGLKKGRVLGALVGNFKFLAYISDNIYIFRTLEIIILLCSIGLFGYLSFKLTKNKRFSVILMVFTLACLPITFEHAVPNAFIIVVVQPLILLLLSLILFTRFIEDESNKTYRNISAALFFWGMCLYEFVITYVLLYPIIYIAKNHMKWQRKSYVKEIWKGTGIYLIVTLVYLILYVIQGKISPTGYSGNTLSFSSIGKIVNVLVTEWKSSLPGYYFFNEKYKYLLNIYQFQKIEQIILFGFGTAAFAVLMGYIILSALCKESGEAQNWLNGIIVVAVALVYTIIPTLPNSLAKLYQEVVSDEFFISIPVSLFLYYAMMFAITYMLCMLFERKRAIGIVGIAVVYCIAIRTQVSNGVFAFEQLKNYDRLVCIEEMLDCNYWGYFGEKSINAPSLYKTQNNLAIENNHWTTYASISGSSIRVVNDPLAEYSLEMQPDNSFYLYSEDEEYLITKKYPESHILLTNVDGDYVSAQRGEMIWQDNGYGVYSLK